MPYVRVNRKDARKQKIKRFFLVFLICLLSAASVPAFTSILFKNPEMLLTWFMRQAFYKRVVDFQNPGSQLSLAIEGNQGPSGGLALKTGKYGAQNLDSGVSKRVIESIVPPTPPIFNYISYAAFALLSFIVVRKCLFHRR